MRALLDTNIVYDILCRRPYDEEGLLQLKIMHAFDDVELWVSAKSYTDLFYLIRRELGTEETQDMLEGTLEWLNVCSVEEADVALALRSRWRDFEDALVNVCAEKIKAGYLVTRDEEGFGESRIPHGSASEFMAFVFEKTSIRYAISPVGE